jgi:hypothetical protein
MIGIRAATLAIVLLAGSALSAQTNQQLCYNAADATFDSCVAAPAEIFAVCEIQENEDLEDCYDEGYSLYDECLAYTDDEDYCDGLFDDCEDEYNSDQEYCQGTYLAGTDPCYATLAQQDYQCSQITN